jgi:shikimate dehydrogenase
MRRFGLIGYPLTHSFSQRYFTEKFQREGIKNCIYENFEVENISRLPFLLRQFPDLHGLNVTIPHKEEMITLLNFQSDVVKEIGACNCIRIEQGLLHGFNTDVTGFERSLSNFLQENPVAALILGTGGSSKAVAYVLKKLKISFSLVSRKPAAGQLSYEQLTEKVMAEHRLIINTTPLGMYPAEKAPSIPYQFLGPGHYLFDLIYNPSKTIFLGKGEKQGAHIKNGYEMLEIQAEESWRIWN